VGKILSSGNVAATAGKLYYDLETPSCLSNLNRLQVSARQRKLGVSQDDFTVWLEKQEAYTLYRPVRKRFPRNPYTVNIMDVRECDVVYVQGLSKYNNGISIKRRKCLFKIPTCRASEIKDRALCDVSV